MDSIFIQRNLFKASSATLCTLTSTLWFQLNPLLSETKTHFGLLRQRSKIDVVLSNTFKRHIVNENIKVSRTFSSFNNQLKAQIQCKPLHHGILIEFDVIPTAFAFAIARNLILLKAT